MLPEVTDPAPATAARGPDVGWLARSTPGRLALSLVLVLLLGCVLVWNIPQHLAVREDLARRVQPVVNLLALNQRWELFSPDPSRTSVDVSALVGYADGTVVAYRFPDGDPFVGALREYRWRKFERRLRSDDRRDLWRRTAVWIADQYRDDAEASGTRVATVTLVRRTSPTPPLGGDGTRTWTSEEFYVLDVAERAP